MSKLVFKYFDWYGRGGTVKLLFKLANVEFEDVIVPFETWNEEKASLGLPLDQLPVLEVDGFTICQSKAIERYAATRAGLLGKCALTDAKGEMLAETISDIRQKVSVGLMSTVAAQFPTEPNTFFKLVDNTQEKKDKRAALMSETYKKMMAEKTADFDKILGLIQTNENFCVGDELTFVDVQVVAFYIFSKDEHFSYDFQKATPKLFKTAENIINKNPKIKEFVDNFFASGKPCTGLGKLV